MLKYFIIEKKSCLQRLYQKINFEVKININENLKYQINIPSRFINKCYPTWLSMKKQKKFNLYDKILQFW